MKKLKGKKGIIKEHKLSVNNKNTTSGITLIALVITIIVLLILAGVTIATLTGDNGILLQANKAKANTEETREFEKVKIAAETALANGLGKISKNDLINSLETEEAKLIGDEPWIYHGDIMDYTITREGTVKRGNSSEITPEYYGETVEYNVPTTEYKGGWQIFYADNENVYLIAKENIGNGDFNYPNIVGNQSNYISDSENYASLFDNSQRYPAAIKWLEGFKNNETGDWLNSKGTGVQIMLYLLDSQNVWNNSYKSDYADYAIGGPTLELLCASYNAKKNSEDVSWKNIVAQADQYERDGQPVAGYGQVISSGLTTNYSYWNNGFSYWLCGSLTFWPAYIWSVDSNRENISNYLYWQSGIGFRPIICLKSENTLRKQNINDKSESWKLILPQEI